MESLLNESLEELLNELLGTGTYDVEDPDDVEIAVVEALIRSAKKKRYKLDVMRDLWKENSKSMPVIEYVFRAARTIFLKDFYSFCLMIGIPVDRNDHYLRVFDEWAENDKRMESNDPKGKSITIIMLPRGALKSTIQIAKGNWKYLRGTIVHKKPPIVMALHGDIDKAEENLTLVRENFDKEIVQRLYPDVLSYKTKSKKSIRFKDNSKITRKEDHFMTGSPRTDPTGKHMTLALIDDWVTSRNTVSPELSNDNKESFYKLFSLDDHSGGKEISLILDIVCTEYAEDSLYRDLENNDDVLFIKIPVCKKQFAPNQMKEEDFNFPEILGERKLTLLKNTIPHNQFISQYDLIPYKRDGGLDFDIELPEYVGAPVEEKRAYVAITADPSISKKNKKSQAVVLVTIIDTEGYLHVVDGVSSFGMKPSEHATWIFAMADKWKANVAIVEAIHYQEALAQEVERKMRERPRGSHIFSVKRHRHFINKREHYKMFLEPLLAQGRIYISPALIELISQINGESSLDDQIDCLSFLKELNIASYSKLKPKIDKEKRNVKLRKRTQQRERSFGAFGM